jgi:hypothetical protein
MAEQGLDVSDLFNGTLNLALDCDTVPYPEDASFDFIIDWRAPDKPTHFRLHRLSIIFGGNYYTGWAYRKLYPLGYKSLHPQPANVLEVLAPYILGICYDDSVEVAFA